MKKILFAMVICLAAIFTACSDNNNENKDIRIPDDQKNQTAFADDTEREIHFTATTDWSTQINYTTKATAADQWVTLDPPSGKAGDVTVKVSLSTNYTGADRKATISIKGGNTTITVIIEQKGETEEGNIPDEDEPVSGIRQVAEIIQYLDEEDFHISFTYDEQGRVSEYSTYEEKGGQKKNVYKSTLNYSNNEIVRKLESFDEEDYNSGVETYTLANNRVYSGHMEDENFDCDSWYYDVEGNMTKYIERYLITQGSIDQDGNAGPTKEVIDSTTSTYIWENGVIKTIKYYPENGSSSDIIISQFEYYSLDEITPHPTSIVLPCLADEIDPDEMTLYGYTGNKLAKFVKKVTISGDKWNKDNGTKTYRYVTDAKGYVTKIYSQWQDAGSASADKEILSCEIKYKE